MKIPATLIILLALLLAAGCVTPSAPGTADTAPLPMNAKATLTTPNTSVTLGIDEIVLEPVKEDGDQELTIRLVANNTGQKPVMLVWFCKLTDTNGKTYGGIGISHAGSGARTYWIQPGANEAPRDYVNIRSDLDIATLSKGAVLDAYVFEKVTDTPLVSMEPDYHARWTIGPGVIG